jgi:hypothetical protein
MPGTKESAPQPAEVRYEDLAALEQDFDDAELEIREFEAHSLKMTTRSLLTFRFHSAQAARPQCPTLCAS